MSTTRELKEKLQLAVEVSAASLASLQRWITSVAHVAIHNQRTLDLLTADRDETCLFLKEECNYYIKETGVVEENSDVLSRLGEERKRRQQQSTSLIPRGWNSALVSWPGPIIEPILIVHML